MGNKSSKLIPISKISNTQICPYCDDPIFSRLFYCLRHTCSDKKCYNFVWCPELNPRPYCFTHACRAYNCQNQMITNRRYCLVHGCLYPHCTGCRKKDRVYCKIHCKFLI